MVIALVVRLVLLLALLLLLFVILLLILFLVLLILLVLLLLLLLFLEFFEFLFHKVAVEPDISILWIENQRSLVALQRALPKRLRLRRLSLAETIVGVSKIVERALLQRAVSGGSRILE